MKSNYVVAPGPVGSGNINFQIEIVRTQCVVCSMGLCVGGRWFGDRITVLLLPIVSYLFYIRTIHFKLYIGIQKRKNFKIYSLFLNSRPFFYFAFAKIAKANF